MKKSHKKSEIPGFFRYLEKKGSRSVPLYPFEYDDEGFFVLAGKKIAPKSFHSRRFDKNLEGIEKQRIPYADMPMYSVMVSDKARIFCGPRLHTYAHSAEFKQTAIPLLGEMGMVASSHDKGLIEVKLQGRNMSINPVYQSNDLDQPQEKGFAEYEISAKADRNDRLLLYEGLGRLACLANRFD